MSSVIGALRVNLGLDSAKFTRGMSEAQKSLADARKQFMAVSAGAALAFGAISAAALKGARDIDEAAKSARRLGSSIGGFRAAQLAAGEMGVSVSALTDNLQTMNREIERGSDGAKRALEALGISAAQLSGLDADQKLALIADRVKALGLNADQASVLLQDLGIRNREMVLAVLNGGDAFREARADVEDYGLAVNSVDAAAIEKANDQIGRLGLISQYAGQQLAIALVPAMGRLAQAMTDSLREGGLLRTVIDGLADNIERLGTYVAVAVAAFGIRYVGALAAAQFATVSLSGALLFLRGALLRTGIGVLVVGAGELVFQFSKLVTAAGGFGNAMALMGDVAKGVWEKIKAGGVFLATELKIAFNDIASAWATLVGNMSAKWGAFLDTVAATKVGEAMGFEGGNETAAINAMNTALSESNDRLTELMQTSNAARRVMDAPLSGLDALRNAMNGGSDTGMTTGAMTNPGQDLLPPDPVAAIEELNERKLGAARRYNEEAQKLTTETADHEIAMRKQTMDSVIGLLGNLGNKSKAFAKAAVALNAAKAIGETIQNTAAASVRALAELGPVAGAAAAARIKLYGAVQVGIIGANAALQMGGGRGGGGGGGGIGSTQPSAATPAQQPETTLRIAIQNDPMGFGESFARQLVEQLNATQRNGGQIRGVIA